MTPEEHHERAAQCASMADNADHPAWASAHAAMALAHIEIAKLALTLKTTGKPDAKST